MPESLTRPVVTTGSASTCAEATKSAHAPHRDSDVTAQIQCRAGRQQSHDLAGAGEPAARLSVDHP
jgi:hypothetical protein